MPSQATDTIALLQQLIACPSVTPTDAGCQTIIRERLKKIGFIIEDLSTPEVTNTWAYYGRSKPMVLFAAHTDVVPPGPLSEWHTPPFKPTIHNETLYGRGAADMKSGLAAMITACERFLKKHCSLQGSIGFMVTSDEEGSAEEGTQKIVAHCREQGIHPEYCIIGEATALKKLGDSVKVGRRGSLYGTLTIHGKQGHIAYPHLAMNPIHQSSKVLDALIHHVWDEGSDDFDPTSFQIYAIHADAGATNLIPQTLSIAFNFRFAPSSTEASLKKQVDTILQHHRLDYTLSWRLSSQPFYSKQTTLLPVCKKIIAEMCGIDTLASTTGGTSDGRFIIELGCELVELGPINHSIHQANEHVAVADVEMLSVLYERILEELLLVNATPNI